MTLLAADARGIPCEAVNSSTLKLRATGDGRASKAAMIEAASRYAGEPVEDHNAADAVCLLAVAEGEAVL